MKDPPPNRRDFLRGVLGRAVRDVSTKAPEAIADAARDLARAERAASRAPTAEEAAEAFVVPDDQRDIAGALVSHHRLLAMEDGRHAVPRDLPGLGAGGEREEVGAVASWLDRMRSGRPIEPSRPRDAMLLAEVRRELGLA